MTITLLFVSCENIERNKLISEFEDLESYRIWTIEKSINENDSVYHERRTFKAFDSNDRLINEGNFKFYYYQDETDRIGKTKNVFKRDRNVKIYTEQYEYDENGLLQNILRVGESIDTIKSYKYDESGNLIKSKTGNRIIIQEFEDGLLKKRIRTDGDAEPRISEFEYDSLNRPIVENWVFSGDHQMKTRFEYYGDGKLYRITDSSYAPGKSPNSIVESRDEFLYDEKDSISEIIQFGRIQSETTFYIRGRRTFERRVEKRK
ncbi:MAG: hypothetical protein D8M25_13135 [Bacteroidetes bacterium]|nr:hypothetical protein [Bacteroidota bacterium]